MVSRPARLALLAAVLAACEPRPAAPPPSMGGVGPVRVGMSAAAAGDTLASLGMQVKCDDEDGITACHTVHAGTIGLEYQVLVGRVVSATRAVASTTPPAPVNALAASWEARYGPQHASEAPAVRGHSVIRHWYREDQKLYRVHVCGRTGGVQACAEAAFDASPAAVAGRLINEAWEERDPWVVACRSWHQMVGLICAKADQGSVRQLQSGEVLRIALGGEGPGAPRGTPVFESDGAVHHRVWRVAGGGLYGISCRARDGTCWEMVARYEPRQFLAALIE